MSILNHDAKQSSRLCSATSWSLRRRTLILESEVLPFRGLQAVALEPLLRRFIEKYRELDDPADLVAVGSAIRNYVATAPSVMPSRPPPAS